eukprot:scaffold10039_cov63-Phaeocystis_antarctica.AAC.5
MVGTTSQSRHWPCGVPERTWERVPIGWTRCGCALVFVRPAPLGSPGAPAWHLAASARDALRGRDQRVGRRAASCAAALHHGVLPRQGRGWARASRAGAAG